MFSHPKRVVKTSVSYAPFSEDPSQGAKHAQFTNYEGQPIFSLSACGMTSQGQMPILPVAIFENKFVYCHAAHGYDDCLVDWAPFASLLCKLVRDKLFEIPLDGSKAQQRRLLQYAPVRRMTLNELIKVQRCRDAYFKPKPQKQSSENKEESELQGTGESSSGADAEVKAGGEALNKRQKAPAGKSMGDSEVGHISGSNEHEWLMCRCPSGNWEEAEAHSQEKGQLRRVKGVWVWLGECELR